MENGEGTSKLTILAARQEHCGCYTLLVENKLGSRQAQVNLTVVGESGHHRGGGWGGRQDARTWDLIAQPPFSLSAPCWSAPQLSHCPQAAAELQTQPISTLFLSALAWLLCFSGRGNPWPPTLASPGTFSPLCPLFPLPPNPLASLPLTHCHL